MIIHPPDSQELLTAAMDGLERAEMLDNNDETYKRGGVHRIIKLHELDNT